MADTALTFLIQCLKVYSNTILNSLILHQCNRCIDKLDNDKGQREKLTFAASPPHLHSQLQNDLLHFIITLTEKE